MRTLLTGILLLLLLPLHGLNAQNNDTNKAATTSPQDHVHRFLALYEGTWTVEASEWITPEADPEKYTLTAVLNMVLGSRFLQWSQTGAGAKGDFEEWATLGYDNLLSRFTLVWLSSTSTQTETAQGYWTEAGKSLTLNPVCDPTGGHSYAITFIDKDNFLVEQYKQGEKGSVKTWEYHYSRQ